MVTKWLPNVLSENFKGCHKRINENKWQDNIEMCLGAVGCETLDWSHISYNRFQ
jgi:hypothetical protein